MSSHTLPPAAAAHTQDIRLLASILAEAEVSLTAKGVLTYTLTRPPGQVLTRAEVLATSQDARHTLDAALAELVEVGWLIPTGQPSDQGYMLREEGRADTPNVHGTRRGSTPGNAGNADPTAARAARAGGSSSDRAGER
jgi:hypothetical protein